MTLIVPVSKEVAEPVAIPRPIGLATVQSTVANGGMVMLFSDDAK